MSGPAFDRHTRLVGEHRRQRLERRYRLLRAMYPKAHRHEHGDEMVGVLLEGSTDRGVQHAFDVGGVYAADWPLSVGGPGVVVLGFCRLRRTAGLVALLLALAQAVVLPLTGVAPLVSPALAFTVLLSCTAGLSLLLSAGAARGLALLRWWGTGLVFIAATVLGGFSLGGFSLNGVGAFAVTLEQVSGSPSGGFTMILPGEIAGLSGDIRSCWSR